MLETETAINLLKPTKNDVNITQKKNYKTNTYTK